MDCFSNLLDPSVLKSLCSCLLIAYLAYLLKEVFEKWLKEKNKATSPTTPSTPSSGQTGAADESKHKWELTQRLVDFMYERTVVKTYDANGRVVSQEFKPIDDDSCKRYTELLEQLAGINPDKKPCTDNAQK